MMNPNLVFPGHFKNLTIGIHSIWHCPISTLNRDRSGTPKTITFGDVPRVIVSGACRKRSWRMSHGLSDINTSVRSNFLARLICDGVTDPVKIARVDLVLQSIGLGAKENEKESDDTAPTASRPKGKKSKKGKKGDTNVIPDAPTIDPDAIVASVDEDSEVDDSVEAKRGKAPLLFDGAVVPAMRALLFDTSLSDLEVCHRIVDLIAGSISFDIMMVGRQIIPSGSPKAWEGKPTIVEPTAIIAPLFTTHHAYPENEAFIAGDDLIGQYGNGSRGAGHMGSRRTASGCFYGYGQFGMRTLHDTASMYYPGDFESIVDKTGRSIREFIMEPISSGLQNSGHHTYPSGVLISIAYGRYNRPLANAFSKPCVAGPNNDLVGNSICALANEANQYTRFDGLPSRLIWVSLSGEPLRTSNGRIICDINLDCIDDAIVEITSALRSEPQMFTYKDRVKRQPMPAPTISRVSYEEIPVGGSEPVAVTAAAEKEG